MYGQYNPNMPRYNPQGYMGAQYPQYNMPMNNMGYMPPAEQQMPEDKILMKLDEIEKKIERLEGEMHNAKSDAGTADIAN